MTKEGLAATMAKVANRQALPERNVLRANILRAPLDFIAEIIQAIIGTICTIVYVLCIPGWCMIFMGSWR
jgi:hypothetical protein